MHMESSESGVFGLCYWKERNKIVRRESGGNTQVENAEIPKRNTIVSGICQLLQTLHPGLLPGSKML